MNDKPRIRIYGSEYCGFCVAAKMMLDRKGISYEDILIDGHPERRKAMEEECGGRTVPQILIDGQPVGGFDELNALRKSGELDRMLGIDESA